MTRLRVAGLLAAACCVGLIARGARAEVTAEQVRDAIDRGVAFLRREQLNDGSWPEITPIMPSGVTALCTLALLNAGVPKDDPQIVAALAALHDVPPQVNYPVALQTMVFATVDPDKELPLLRRNVSWFEASQKREQQNRGMWSYPLGAGDNSNSQFAILALYEAQRVGAKVDTHHLKSALAYWQSTQNSDGSWGYLPGNQGTGSMTCAGIGAVSLLLDVLEEGDASVEGDRVRCCRPQKRQPTIDRALDWLSRNFSVQHNPNNPSWSLYYLYGLERAGRLTNQRFIGRHDWYREGAEALVAGQERITGSWAERGLGQNNPHVGTSFALLFLSKGRRPVVAAKLKHHPQDDWNHHRKDVSNVVAFAERRWKRDLTWQIIDIDAARTEDLLEAPVLVISGQDEPEFSDQQVRMLRDYVDRGGFIFADANCSGENFDSGFRELIDRIFPEPDYKLRLLPPEHPIWVADGPVEAKHQRPLWGVDLGCRTCVAYCPENLSCYWELARPNREKKYPPEIERSIDAAKQIGVNVLAYATNREPKNKLEMPLLEGNNPREKFDRAKLYVATIKHSGGGNLAPLALPNLLRYLSGELGLRANTDDHDLTLGDDRLFEFPVLFMHGRDKFSLNDAERAKLKIYLERGGTLFADAICSNKAFADSFRQEIATIFPDRQLANIAADDPLFTRKFGGFDLKIVDRREHPPADTVGGGAKAPKGVAAIGAGAARSAIKLETHHVEPELEVLKLGDRYAVLFSRYDLSCALERPETAECVGYTRDSAARIGLNVMLYAIEQ